jgi:DNA-binding transcriptional ArsR family regulator
MLKPASRVRPDAYEAVFGALAHPARRRVLLAVYFNGGAMTAGEIAAIFAHAWQTTTRHLQVLEAAGLLRHERQGRMRIYRIERKHLALVSKRYDRHGGDSRPTRRVATLSVQRESQLDRHEHGNWFAHPHSGTESKQPRRLHSLLIEPERRIE